MKEIIPRTDINTVVNIPGSKSLSHRALITAGLARGESKLESFLTCEDTLLTLNALKDMGVEISTVGDDVLIKGNGGSFALSTEKKDIYLGNSGTSFRLLLSVAALGRGEFIFRGAPRMNSRPIKALVDAMCRLGVQTTCIEQNGYPPVHINAMGIKGGKVEISGDISSQYISSLLLSGPYAEKDVTIEVIGKLISRPYLDLTMDVMDDFGVQVEHDDYKYFRVPSGKEYQARSYRIDGDISSASYFWGAAAVTGGEIRTKNIHPISTRQGDIALLNILEKMGCHIEKRTDEVVVRGDRLSGVEVDMGAMPDMVPTLASVALFADGKTTIRNVAHLRHKESDRLGDTAREWSRLGARVVVLEDGLEISGGDKLHGALLDPHNDHRLAMSLAIVGLKVPGIMIKNENCVDKSFPSFWKLWESI